MAPNHQWQQLLNHLEPYLPGKEKPLRLALIALLSGGHILLQDLPGQGKTTLALALARALGLEFGRIQCTSDLLPSDMTGLSVYHRRQEQFYFVPGPLFAQVVLVDEINRATPKTQSALLEAMAEGRVTIEGVSHELPRPFLVFATQNPIEHHGTFPLPEAQLDRFLLMTDIGYPPPKLEKQIIQTGSIREQLQHIPALMTAEDILACRRQVEEVELNSRIADYILALTQATREHPHIYIGLSTRGAQALAQAAKAAAFLAARHYVIPDDVQELFSPIAAHRLSLPHGNEDKTAKEALSATILQHVAVPKG